MATARNPFETVLSPVSLTQMTWLFTIGFGTGFEINLLLRTFPKILQAEFLNLKAYIIGRKYNVLDVWKQHGQKIIGYALNSGHFLAEENPLQVMGALNKFI